MLPGRDIAALRSALLAVQQLLNRYNNQGVVIGGVAASLLGKPRLTADIDLVLLLSTEELPGLIEAAAQEGLEPRVLEAEEFARRRRVLLLSHVPSGVDVDISLGILPFEQEAVERGSLYQIGSMTVRLPTPEDLIILKAVAHRPQDLEDIQAIIEAHPRLDRARIERWVKEFAEVLETPQLWNDIASWL